MACVVEGGPFRIESTKMCVSVCTDIDSFPIAQFSYSLVEMMFAIACSLLAAAAVFLSCSACLAGVCARN